jgi:hypothetical protein
MLLRRGLSRLATFPPTAAALTNAVSVVGGKKLLAKNADLLRRCARHFLFCHRKGVVTGHGRVDRTISADSRPLPFNETAARVSDSSCCSASPQNDQADWHYLAQPLLFGSAMRTLLRHTATGQYFRSLGNWTIDPENAHDFGVVARAVKFVRKTGLPNMEVDLRFDNQEQAASFSLKQSVFAR